MSSDLIPVPDPKVPMWRRYAALGIDFLLVGLLCFALSANGLTLLFVFMMSWLVCRVVVVSKNQGQSLGHWAFDIRVVDSQFYRTPRLLELTKREAVIGLGAFLFLLGLGNLASGNAAILLLMLPIIIDCGAVLFDTSRHPQTVHDRIGHTIVIGSRRGYSLDVKIRYFIDKVKREMK
ncbi:RDD family protein [Planktothrix sp. FACHB-1365]|uniref:RDD family protein n=1 Tax=Planktothrix sp. FACHB-1365 TaxID=2692855 RepID=UPI001685091F|nr:RDD family protein [Planktothrix sp. FACHB-1365]MBD2482992.1 RDD family protein [Planktothrix sp. FACHB-1365]